MPRQSSTTNTNNVDVSNLLNNLVQALQHQKSNDHVDLPFFNPKVNELAKWVSQINLIKNEMGWTDIQVLGKISKFLSTEAKFWFERWDPDVRNWQNFQRDFEEAFPPKRNLGFLLEKASNYKSCFVNTYSTYLHEKVAMLRNLRANWSEEDLVQLIIHGISEIDIRNTITKLNLKTVRELNITLSSYTKPLSNKFVMNKLNNEPLKRKFTMKDQGSNEIKCFQCGKIGHIQAECYSKKVRIDTTKNVDKPSSSKQNQSLVCSFCAKQGHEILNCFIKKAIDKRRQINFCSSGQMFTPTEVFIEGHRFSALIDTGADLSLISQKFQHLFKDKTENCNVILRGISNITIEAFTKFQGHTRVSNIETLISYVFVPDNCLDYDVFIGRHLFEDHNVVLLL